MEENHDKVSIQKYEDEISQLRKEKEEVMKEYQAHKDEIKKDNIASYMDSLKTEGKILPVQYKEVEALLSTATDEKVFSYSKVDKEINLSQVTVSPIWKKEEKNDKKSENKFNK